MKTEEGNLAVILNETDLTALFVVGNNSLSYTPKIFAFPVGDATSAGPREFGVAKDLGFLTAVTTRPGVLYGAHVDHLHALPRMSVNGLFQDSRALESLVSGAPTALMNLGRRIDVA